MSLNQAIPINLNSNILCLTVSIKLIKSGIICQPYISIDNINERTQIVLKRETRPPVVVVMAKQRTETQIDQR